MEQKLGKSLHDRTVTQMSPKTDPPGRKRPKLVATRVTRGQKDGIVTLARLEGRSVADLLYSLIMPEVQRRLEQRLGDMGMSE